MERIRYLNLGTISGNESGNGPEKLLHDKSSDLILALVQLRMNCGKVPLGSLRSRDKTFKLGMGENLAYSGLVRWLFPRLKSTSIGSLLSW